MNYQDVPLPPAPSTPEDAFSESWNIYQLLSISVVELPTNFNDVTLEDEEVCLQHYNTFLFQTIRKNQERIMREKLEQAQRDAIAKREKEMKKVWVDVKQRESIILLLMSILGRYFSRHMDRDESKCFRCSLQPALIGTQINR